jgi:hypothetical protein
MDDKELVGKEQIYDQISRTLEQLEWLVNLLQLPLEEQLRPKIRRRLMVLACEVNDYLIWVRQEDDGSWTLDEIESGDRRKGHATWEEALTEYAAPGPFPLLHKADED